MADGYTPGPNLETKIAVGGLLAIAVGFAFLVFGSTDEDAAQRAYSAAAAAYVAGDLVATGSHLTDLETGEASLAANAEQLRLLASAETAYASGDIAQTEALVDEALAAAPEGAWFFEADQLGLLADVTAAYDRSGPWQVGEELEAEKLTPSGSRIGLQLKQYTKLLEVHEAMEESDHERIKKAWADVVAIAPSSQIGTYAQDKLDEYP
jgi:hypothetical protein